jgi:hypothetical protein
MAPRVRAPFQSKGICSTPYRCASASEHPFDRSSPDVRRGSSVRSIRQGCRRSTSERASRPATMRAPLGRDYESSLSLLPLTSARSQSVFRSSLCERRTWKTRSSSEFPCSANRCSRRTSTSRVMRHTLSTLDPSLMLSSFAAEGLSRPVSAWVTSLPRGASRVWPDVNADRQAFGDLDPEDRTDLSMSSTIRRQGLSLRQRPTRGSASRAPDG